MLRTVVPLETADQVDDGSGRCIWYDTCDDCDGQRYNYLYRGKAKALTDQNDLETLRGVCPELVSDLGRFHSVYTSFKWVKASPEITILTSEYNTIFLIAASCSIIIRMMLTIILDL